MIVSPADPQPVASTGLPGPQPSTMTVGDLMTGDLVALFPTSTVARAREILLASGLHAIPIIENDRPIGVVTLADCQDRSPDEPLRAVIAGPPVTVATSATAVEAATLMRGEHLHHLLVTEPGSGELIGILSSLDLLYLLTY